MDKSPSAGASRSQRASSAGTATPLRFLVLDAYPRDGRAALEAAGGTAAGVLYERMLHELEPGCDVDIAYPAHADDALPAAASLEQYDGLAWTGSSLSIYDDRPETKRQIELAGRAFEIGVPQFGSCFAVQLAAVAAGGSVGASPKGREFGVARQVRLTSRGQGHDLHRGRSADGFEALTCHADRVETLPEGAVLLAWNEHSEVQSLEVKRGAGSFWAVQYHPEYDLHEIAALSRLRAASLVAEGRFTSDEEVFRWSETVEALAGDPARSDLAAVLEVGDDVLEAAERHREVRNWIDARVVPARAGRASRHARS